MSEERMDSSTLALELTEVGLSLYLCDGDVPLECLAHVSLDAPDFSRKLGYFRKAAEAVAGADFETEIWLPDEQIFLRSLKLDEEDTADLRAAAQSALSASTPVAGTALSFDLGQTNAAGYTPVAAIPQDKMDEAMSFVGKMRLNPRKITTSNVIAGFSERPEFRPHVPQVSRAAGHLRVAALAMMLATPIFLLSSEIEKTYRDPAPVTANALVASLSPTPAQRFVAPMAQPALDEVSPAAPAASDPGVILAPRPELHSGRLPAPQDWTRPAAPEDAAPVLAQHADLPAIAPISETSNAPHALVSGAPAVDAPQLAAAKVLPDMLGQRSIVASIEVALTPQTIAVEYGALDLPVDHEIVLSAPLEMFESGADKLPRTEYLRLTRVEGLFDADTTIFDLAASEPISRTLVPSERPDPRYVRVANIGSDVLVKRPKTRAAPRLIRPIRLPRPEPRPVLLLPERAFDPNSLIPLDVGIAVEDPPPPMISGQNDASLNLQRPEALLVVLDRATQAIMDLARVTSRAKAEKSASDARFGPLARMAAPKARHLVPLAGTADAMVQVGVRDMRRLDETRNPKLIAGADAARPAQPGAPLRLAARADSVPSLPRAFAGHLPTEGAARPLAPYRPGFAPASEDVQTASLNRESATQRPPSRRVSDDLIDPVNAGLQSPVPAAEIPRAGDEGSDTSAAPAEAAPEILSGTDAAEVAAVADFFLPRPPKRAVPPKRTAPTTDIAALIEGLEPPAQTGPVSKMAPAAVLSPFGRPADLAARARAILKAREDVAKEVARKQQPKPATSSGQLRIPSGARVAATATIKDGIALGDISLIGIFGTSKSRRALVRLPQGRYVQISRGDRVRGWVVSAVGDDAVRIQKGSKNRVLRLPN